MNMSPWTVKLNLFQTQFMQLILEFEACFLKYSFKRFSGCCEVITITAIYQTSAAIITILLK